jgi:ryanodine receptor 2
MTYTPSPIDTSNIDLPEDLTSLVEQLAEHVHDTWAENRIQEGWSHGPTRDDASKEHPCLVPYEELPETEKDYDRQTALEALKAVQALGYTIVPPRTDGCSSKNSSSKNGSSSRS